MSLKLAVAQAALVSVAVAGCATQTTGDAPSVPESAVVDETPEQESRALQKRRINMEQLLDVSDRIRIAGADMCPTVTERAGGYSLVRNEEIRGFGERAAATVFGPDERVKFARATEGLAADRAGVRVGDVLLSVNGVSVTSVNDAVVAFSDADPAVSILIERNGEAIAVGLERDRACANPVRYVDEHFRMSATHNRAYIYVSEDLMELIENDDELALVVGHELGRRVLEYRGAKRGQVITGGAIGLAIDVGLAVAGVNTAGHFTGIGTQMARSYSSPEHRRESDYFAAYFARRAGYDIAKGSALLRRTAAEPGTGEPLPDIQAEASKRIASIRGFSDEIDAKSESGTPLFPSGFEKIDPIVRDYDVGYRGPLESTKRAERSENYRGRRR